MKGESRHQRLMHLARLGRALNMWHFVYAIIFITFFPYLTVGTTIHEYVVLFSRYGTLGVLLAPLYVKLMRLLLGWYVKTGRNLESPTLVPMLLVGGLIGALISYVILRIFKHEGNWETTLDISREDAVISLLFNLLLAMLMGVYTLTIIYYGEGENIIMRHSKPTPFWKVLVMLFSIPFFLVLMAFAGYFAN